eukprot:TRINITY_DN16893_c0_g1_i1.p1 TRINITY_DN16893_c0_g1~~TRINITY_DN16893_c0_g1_i1.p1  ORF type:complete len:400 (+),score=79.36 TRINITY_DN16893_c0_g1_i1:39-1202(+)
MAEGPVLLCPWIQAFIAELRGTWREYSYSRVQDSSCDTPATSGATPRLGDRFVLQIPYCKTYLAWEVLFQKTHPTVPPDLILENSGADPSSSLEPQPEWFDLAKCASLAAWGTDGCFLRLVEEVLEQFLSHQATLVSNFPNERVQYEYSTVCGLPGVEYLVTEEEAGHRLRMMVPLEVDLQPVHDCYLNGARAKGQCRLYVELLPNDATQNVAIERSEVDWPTSLLQLPWLVDFAFPRLTISSCLIQFIPELTAAINQVIAQRVARFTRRRLLSEALMKRFGTPVEYDAEQYTCLAFLFQTTFAWLLYVTMQEADNSFPAEPPLVHLLSVDAFKMVNGRPSPVRCRLQNMAYSPDWDATRVVDALREKLLEVEREFGEICCEMTAQS